MKSLLLACALLTAAAPATAARVPDAAAVPTAAAEAPAPPAQALLERLREHYALPALAAVVVRADATLDLAVTGVRRQGMPDKVAPGDRFHLGSMGKAITATVIARLVEEGTLAWTTRPADVFPELAKTLHPGYRNLTLEQLLRHEGGVPAYDAIPQIKAAQAKAQAGGGTPRAQRRAFSVWLLQQKPRAAPGTRPEYSNAGYPVAAAMAEAAAGEDWGALVESRLARPLGIHLQHGLPARGDSAQPWGHTPKPAFLGMAAHAHALEPQPPDDGWALGDVFDAAGDYSLSLADYATFLQLHLAGLAGRDGLLQAATIQRLHAGPGEYAMGWFLREYDGTTAHWHTGATPSFFSRVILLPARDIAVAVLTNAGNEAASEAAREASLELLRIHGAAAAR